MDDDGAAGGMLEVYGGRWRHSLVLRWPRGARDRGCSLHPLASTELIASVGCEEHPLPLAPPMDGCVAARANARLRRRRQLEDRPGRTGRCAGPVDECVELAVRVLPDAEQRHAEARLPDVAELEDAAPPQLVPGHEDVALRQVEEPAIVVEGAREVAEDVVADEAREHRAAVDEAADDGEALVVVVLGDRIDQVRRHAVVDVVDVAGADAVVVEEELAFLELPAVVAAGGDDVDLLDRVLPDVAGVERVRRGVEREAERVAEAVRPDLAEGARLADERVGRGDAVLAVGGVVAVRVDAQQLAEDRAQVLRVARRSVADGRARDERLSVLVVGAAAVTEADVEEAVGAEDEGAAVVVELRLVEAQHLARAAGIDGRAGIGRVRYVPFGDHALAVGRRAGRQGREVGRARRRLGRERVDEAVRRVARIERDAEEAALVVGAGPEHAERNHARGDVEEDALRAVGQVDAPEDAGLIDDEEELRIDAGRRRRPHRRDEAGRSRRQHHLLMARADDGPQRIGEPGRRRGRRRRGARRRRRRTDRGDEQARVRGLVAGGREVAVDGVAPGLERDVGEGARRRPRERERRRARDGRLRHRVRDLGAAAGAASSSAYRSRRRRRSRARRSAPRRSDRRTSARRCS